MCTAHALMRNQVLTVEAEEILPSATDLNAANGIQLIETNEAQGQVFSIDQFWDT